MVNLSPKIKKKPGLIARWIAVELLNSVTRDKKPISGQLEAHDLFKGLEASERARSQRLAIETLRYLERIDSVLIRYLDRLPPINPLNVLRLAVFEICAEKIPPHAVVDSAVSLMKGSGGLSQFAGLANAILRKVSKNEIETWHLGEITKLPKWLRRRLIHAYDEAIINNIELSHMNGARVDITLKPGLNITNWAEKLDAVILPTGSLRLKTTQQISNLPGYKEGMWWVQDAAAAIPVKVIETLKGKYVLDACAAPGGKTLQLASLGAEVVAIDRSSSRVETLQKNLYRTKFPADVIQADFLKWKVKETFDVILLDAPCTATGTIRRHPDLPIVKNKEDLTSVFTLQADMIDKAVTLLKPSGKLIFSTCSLLPDEGENQIKMAKKRHNLRAVKISVESLGLNPKWYNTDLDCIRLRPDYWPELGGIDGFFICVLENGK